jgi:hypothetical protein
LLDLRLGQRRVVEAKIVQEPVEAPPIRIV